MYFLEPCFIPRLTPLGCDEMSEAVRVRETERVQPESRMKEENSRRLYTHPCQVS